MFSTRWLFTASAAGFTVASVLCGLAWNIESMIVFRALQGLLGASMIPTVFTSSFHYFQGPRRVYSAAVIGTIASIAPTLGPVIGGWITDTLNWHWLFYVNLVPGWPSPSWCRCWSTSTSPISRCCKGADYPGIALMAVGLGTLEYVLEEGHALELVRRCDHPQLRVIAGVAGLPVRRPQPHLRAPRRRSARVRQPQLRDRLLPVVHHRHRHLLDDLPDAAVPRLCARLQRLADRRGDLLDRRSPRSLGVPVYIFLAKRFDTRWLMMAGSPSFGLCDVELQLHHP